MSARYLLGVISFAVLGRLTDFNVLTLDLDATFLGALLTAVLTAVAFGLRVLVLRTLGAADAVIKNQICLTVLIYMKKPPSGGWVCQFVDWSSYLTPENTNVVSS